MPGTTGVRPHAHLDACSSTEGQALIGPAWVTCPARSQSGESWVARSGSGAALEVGAWSGPSEPQELDHRPPSLRPPPPIRMWHREATPWCSSHAPGIGATKKRKSNHRHCCPALPTCSATPCRWGLLLPPSPARGAQSLSRMSGGG